MNQIKLKLRSRAGVTMILAMLFMLFCSFVGGTILASATANAQRVAQMAEQQDFLLERSAALLASDQFQLENGQYLRLNVSDSDRKVDKVTVNPDGSTNILATTRQRVIVFQVDTTASLTQMHNLLIETTVHRYLREYCPDYKTNNSAYDVKLVFNPNQSNERTVLPQDFLFTYTQPGSESHNYDIEGTLTVTSSGYTGQDVTIPDYEANFTSGRGEYLFDFFLYFGTGSQVKMTLNAFHGANSPITVSSPPSIGTYPGESGQSTIQITDITTQHTISWEDPLIEKGGAQ